MFQRIKARVYLSIQRKKFPTCAIHKSVAICRESYLGKHVALFTSVHVLNSNIGRFSYVQSDSEIVNSDIGPFCSISKSVLIGAVDHPTHEVSTSPIFYDNSQPLPLFLTQRRSQESNGPRTQVGADTWIGANCIIRSGVKIGVGAVIGASSVITRDVDPYSIVVGSPGREIGKRFEQSVMSQLISSRWWDLDERYLLKLSPFFNSPEVFLKQLEGLS
jgi:acetyltransferase-like isoleucine patch superfamily enzyme